MHVCIKQTNKEVNMPHPGQGPAPATDPNPGHPGSGAVGDPHITTLAGVQYTL